MSPRPVMVDGPGAPLPARRTLDLLVQRAGAVPLFSGPPSREQYEATARVEAPPGAQVELLVGVDAWGLIACTARREGAPIACAVEVASPESVQDDLEAPGCAVLAPFSGRRRR